MLKTSTNRPIILFDGVCNLCNSVVRWVIARDTEKRFVFASLQSDAARRELEKILRHDEIEALPESIVLVDSDGVHVRSTAAMRIARGLGGPYALLGLGVVLPRPARDAIYSVVARKRYRWFGRREICMIPTLDVAERFLDAGEPRHLTYESHSRGRRTATGTDPQTQAPPDDRDQNVDRRTINVGRAQGLIEGDDREVDHLLRKDQNSE